MAIGMHPAGVRRGSLQQVLVEFYLQCNALLPLQYPYDHNMISLKEYSHEAIAQIIALKKFDLQTKQIVEQIGASERTMCQTTPLVTS